MARELEGKTALITGSTRGIGAATAKLLAREGATVIVSGRDVHRGADVIAQIETAGGTARFVEADLTDLSSVRNLASEVGDVDVLINTGRASSPVPAFASTPSRPAQR